MFGFIKEALRFGVKLISFLKPKPTLTDALPWTVSQILPAVKEAIAYKGMDTKEKFDAWLKTGDEATGSDPNAVDVFKDMLPGPEEEFFDSVLNAARIYGYTLLRVPGYHVEG